MGDYDCIKLEPESYCQIHINVFSEETRVTLRQAFKLALAKTIVLKNQIPQYVPPASRLYRND